MTLLAIQEECQTFSLPNYVDVHPLYVEYENNINFIQTNTVRLTEESLKQTLKHHNSKLRVQKKSSEQFNSISLFNTLLEAKTSGKYLQ